MTIFQRITREPALITGAVRAVLYSAVLFGLPLTDEQSAGLLLALEAVLVLVTRAVVTPSSEVVAQAKPGELPVAGPAANFDNGDRVLVLRDSAAIDPTEAEEY
ncbi:hypothetical protein [Nocardioides campestrisoli]|uniref:hypothetical protein n=1 Tax=Nocardioides campestrisoli TaxID=2736757 RepID=UPI0015E725BE|nr:hypothetical protein [Nocardioides campestrisoli]